MKNVFEEGKLTEDETAQYSNLYDEELAIYIMNDCQVLDFDTFINDEFVASKELILQSISQVLTSQKTPCVIEETTRGYHLIILSTQEAMYHPYMICLGYDPLYAKFSEENDHFRLRTRRKAMEMDDQHFIKSRTYHNLGRANSKSVLEYLKYSDTLLFNSHLYWGVDADGEGQSEEIPF
jgi:hypothetical protein